MWTGRCVVPPLCFESFWNWVLLRVRVSPALPDCSPALVVGLKSDGQIPIFKFQIVCSQPKTQREDVVLGEMFWSAVWGFQNGVGLGRFIWRLVICNPTHLPEPVQKEAPDEKEREEEGAEGKKQQEEMMEDSELCRVSRKCFEENVDDFDNGIRKSGFEGGGDTVLEGKEIGDVEQGEESVHDGELSSLVVAEGLQEVYVADGGQDFALMLV